MFINLCLVLYYSTDIGVSAVVDVEVGVARSKQHNNDCLAKYTGRPPYAYL